MYDIYIDFFLIGPLREFLTVCTSSMVPFIVSEEFFFQHIPV